MKEGREADKKIQLEGKENEAKEEEIDIEYTEMIRVCGTGPCRIGHPIPMGEDVYSMLFANCLNSDYFYYYKNKDKIEAEE